MSLFHILNPDEQDSNRITVDPTRLEVDEDYISKLPDDVLRHILLIRASDAGSKAVALLTGLWDRPWVITIKIQDFKSALRDFLAKYDKNNPVKKPRKVEFHIGKELVITASIGFKRKPNLDISSSLRYSGLFCLFSWKNAKNFKAIKLDIKGPGLNHFNPRLYNPLLQTFQDVTALKLHGCMCKEIFGPLLSSKKYEEDFNFSKLEELYWIDSCMEDHNMNIIFGFLKFCSSLKRLFIRIDTRSQIDTRSDSKPCVDEHESTTKVHHGRLRKLKLVKMEGFENEVDIMLFKERLLQVFNVEPRIVELRKGMPDRCLLRLTKGQPYSKAIRSEKCKFAYRFVADVDTIRKTQPDRLKWSHNVSGIMIRTVF